MAGALNARNVRRCLLTLFAGLTVQGVEASLVRERAEGALDFSRLAYSNLGGKGPDYDAPAGLRYADVAEVSGIRVDLLITAPFSNYAPVDASLNGLFLSPRGHLQRPHHGGALGVFNVLKTEKDDEVALRFQFLEANTSRPVQLPRFYFSVFDVDSNEEFQIGGFELLYVTNNTALEYRAVENRTFFRASAADKRNAPLPSGPLALPRECRSHAVTYHFEETAEFPLVLRVQSSGPAGWNFIFGSASDAPHYAIALPIRALRSGSGEWRRIAFAAFQKGPTTPGHRAGEAHTESCGWPVSCELSLTHLAHNNLAGAGPDAGHQHLRYKNVCGRGTVPELLNKEVDLLILNESAYSSQNGSRNGLSALGPYGVIDVPTGTMASLRAKFVLSGTETPINVGSFYFSIVGLHARAREREDMVTVDLFTQSYLSPASLVRRVPMRHGQAFEYSGMEDESVSADDVVPADPLVCTEAQRRRSISWLFTNVSEFSFSLSLLGRRSNASHRFLFGGRSCASEHCGSSSLAPSTATRTSTVQGLQMAEPAEYNCSAGQEIWEHDWSMGKKLWCCDTARLQRKLQLQSELTWMEAKNSSANLSALRVELVNAARAPMAGCYSCESPSASWDGYRKRWCCLAEDIGCSSAEVQTNLPPAVEPPTPPRIRFRCQAGLAHWQVGWSEPKKAWCCKHEDLGCYDCLFPRMDWSAHRKEWCCRRTGYGCDFDGLALHTMRYQKLFGLDTLPASGGTAAGPVPSVHVTDGRSTGQAPSVSAARLGFPTGLCVAALLLALAAGRRAVASAAYRTSCGRCCCQCDGGTDVAPLPIGGEGGRSAEPFFEQGGPQASEDHRNRLGPWSRAAFTLLSQTEASSEAYP